MEQFEREASPEIGLAGRMIRLFTAPSETFEAVRRRATWLDWFAPVLLVAVLSMAAMQLTFPVVRQAQEKMLQERLKELPGEQRAAVLEKVRKSSAIGAMIGIPVGSFAVLFLAGGVLLLIARFALGGEVAYGQMLAVYGYSSLIGIAALLVRTPLMLAKGEMTVHTGPGIFLSEEMLKTFPGRILAGVDLFTFWQVCVMAVGLAVLSGSPTRKALIPLLILWAVWIVVQAGLGSLGAMFAPGA